MANLISAEGPTLENFTTSNNKYLILGVSPDASWEVLRKAYHKLALLFHPDRHNDMDKARAARIFVRISDAYRTLSDSDMRRNYDEYLSRKIEPDDQRRHDQKVDPFAQIFKDILKYEHIFNDDELYPRQLGNFLHSNLLKDLREQIVCGMPIYGVPKGCELKHKGSFQSGSMVLTNFRILFPFWCKWRDGNSGQIHRAYYIPMVMFPEIQKVKIVAKRQVFRATHIQIFCQDREIILTETYKNQSKLLLLCSLWGVPVLTEENMKKLEEILDSIFMIPIGIGLAQIGIYVVMLIVLFLSENDSVLWLLLNLWHFFVFVWAVGIGLGINRAMQTYGCRHVTDILFDIEKSPSGERAGGG